MRCANPPPTRTDGQRGPLCWTASACRSQWEGEVVLLSLTEFWIVHALARHPGHVRNRQQLMDAANVVLDDNTITSHVKRIRRKFQAAGSASSMPSRRCTAWAIAGSSEPPELHVAAPEAAVARPVHAGPAVGRLRVRAPDGGRAARRRAATRCRPSRRPSPPRSRAAPICCTALTAADPRRMLPAPRPGDDRAGRCRMPGPQPFLRRAQRRVEWPHDCGPFSALALFAAPLRRLRAGRALAWACMKRMASSLRHPQRRLRAHALCAARGARRASVFDAPGSTRSIRRPSATACGSASPTRRGASSSCSSPRPARGGQARRIETGEYGQRSRGRSSRASSAPGNPRTAAIASSCACRCRCSARASACWWTTAMRRGADAGELRHAAQR